MNSNSKQVVRAREARAEARASADRPDDGEAFLPDPQGRRGTEHGSLTATDGESFAEEFIASATAGEPVEMDAQDEVVEEEWGGPFLELEPQEGDSAEAIPEPPALHKLPPRIH
jgi:hypothetical protein